MDALKHKYAIQYLCNVLSLNRSSYYYFFNTKENEETAAIKENIRIIFRNSKETYGRRRMTVAINQRMNKNYNVKRIRRLMIEMDLECVIRKKRRIYPKVKKDYVAENLLNRNFNAAMENQIWSRDITEIPTAEGKLYLSAIIDVHSRSIISHELSNKNDNELVFRTFQKAFEREDVTLENLTIQTDRGYQYTSFGFKKLIGDIKHSMNRPGHCPDNSPIESFWGIFKSECLYNKNYKSAFQTKSSAILATTQYLDFYNNSRITLKSTTPSKARYDAFNQKNIL